MKELLVSYVRSVLIVAAVASALQLVLPEGHLRRYAVYATALITTAAMLLPLTHLSAGEINLPEETSLRTDYTAMVTQTVRSVEGYENALVSLEQDGQRVTAVTITVSYDLLVKEGVRKLTEGYLKQTLSKVYGVQEERIQIRS